MVLFYKQPGVCILLLRTLYPLQSLRATVGREQRGPALPGADQLGHDSASRAVFPWVGSSGQKGSTASTASCTGFPSFWKSYKRLGTGQGRRRRQLMHTLFLP